jgi:hypothetical protein
MFASAIMASMTISPVLLAKADPALREELSRRNAAEDRELLVLFALTIPPMVEQPASGTQADRADAWSRRFDEAATAFVRALERAGARRIERYWINSSVSAFVRRPALDALAERDDVKQVILVVERNIML